MIDFRYHVVSMVAVFLALAVGIVLGSGPLKDDISGFLEDRTEQLAQEKVELQDEVSALRSDLEYNERFAELAQPVLVDDLLSSHATALIVLPDAEGDHVDAVEEAITSAGGQVSERVTIEPAWGDPDQTDVLGRLAEGVARPNRDEEPYDIASQVLADALLTSEGRAVGEPVSDTIALALLEGEGFISADESEVVRGDTAVVVGPSGSAPNADRTLIPLLAALDDVGVGTVLAAPRDSDGSTGVIGLLRDSDIDGFVSTEDRLETVTGVTVTIAALAEQIAGGVGHYGTGEGSDGPAPDPLPRG